MRTVGTFEAKTHLIELLREVSKGETVTITKRGEPVAVLTPVPAQRTSRLVAAEELRKLRQSLPRVSPEELRSWIEEGRK